MVVKPGEVAARLPLRPTICVRIAGFEQFVSFGPYSLKVIEPVGLLPPVKTAASLMTVPIGPPGLGVVDRVGLAQPNANPAVAGRSKASTAITEARVRTRALLRRADLVPIMPLPVRTADYGRHVGRAPVLPLRTLHTTH